MEFDYVIVGGGSGGSVLAARLSEDPGSVCLLEAGGDGKGLLVRAPIGMVAMLPGRPKINNWAFETVPQPGSVAGAVISRAAGRWADPAPSTPCSMFAATPVRLR
jgi:choline dehydrogenase-like flavoprotein